MTLLLTIKDVIESDKRISYIRRGEECSSSNAHFNCILETNTSEYFMLFHDDDEMLPNMVSSLYEYLSSHDVVSAVGCNAYLNINGKNTKKEKVFLYDYKKKWIIVRAL